jgi:hypothetical protein
VIGWTLVGDVPSLREAVERKVIVLKSIRAVLVVVALAVGIGFIGVEVASAACNSTATALVSPVCGPSGYSISATIGQVACSLPSAVNAEVYDNAANLIETIPLTYNSFANTWNGVGACINPNVGYQVRFVATGGQIEDTTGVATTVNCGLC